MNSAHPDAADTAVAPVTPQSTSSATADTSARRLSVFVSHSSRDRRFVEQEITPLLTRHGLQPWYSREQIKTAEEWEQRVLRGLEECEWFLVILSPSAVASDWVRREVTWAMTNRPGRLVPLLLRTSDFQALHQHLSAIQYVDYRRRLGAARARLLAVWSRSLYTTPPVTEALRIGWLVLRGQYWRLGRVAAIAAAIVAAAFCLLVLALLWAQDPVARQLATGLPIARCQAEPYGSAVQLFDRGWLVARFATGRFFAIWEQPNGIAWKAFPDTYKSGQQADCQTVPNEGLLRAGFRKLYCQEQRDLEKDLGAPRTAETKAYVQFQDWSHGLLVFGLPGTQIGMTGDEHKFTRLEGAFLAGAGTPSGGGVGRKASWTEGTSPFSDECSAIWFRLVGGRQSPLIASRCTDRIRASQVFVEGAITCSRF